MSRAGPFNPPFCIGFEKLGQFLEHIAKSPAESFPPLNVEEMEAGLIRLTLAVAGFPPECLSVTLTRPLLSIKGERPFSAQTHQYLHKGIAERGFHRQFYVSHDLDIKNASLAQGLLRIDLQRRTENQQKVQIPITSR